MASRPRAGSSSSGAGSASSVNNTGSNSIEIENEEQHIDLKYPLWAHATRVVSSSGSRGGNAKFTCHFCKNTYPGSYSRVRAHLLQIRGMGFAVCAKVPHAVLEQLRNEERAASETTTNTMPKNQLIRLPPFEESGLPPTYSSKKRKGKQSGIEASFHAETRHIADSHIARLFYTGVIPFNVARNPEYRASYNFIANNNLGGYVPPGYNALRTTLLQKEKAHVERMLEPIKTTWPFKGVTIAADGWSDPQRRPILNFIAVSAGSPMFLRAINTEGEVKNKEFIFDKLKEVIEEVGSKNVVQVITDNAANCKAAGLMIESKYKNIFWTPCVVHTLNLALKNICAPRDDEGDNEELIWIKRIAEDASYIKNYIMNHGMRLAMFNDFSKIKFLAIAETRFASVVVMLKRFLLVKEALTHMVVSEKWMAYREDGVEKAQAVKQKILCDTWWDQVKYIVEFTDPIYSMLRAADTDKPCLHLIYEMWDTMIEKVRACVYRKEGIVNGPSVFFYVLYKILIARWTKSSTPLHCLAHSLNPRYYTHAWINEVDGRVSPNHDGEINRERNLCFKKFFPDLEDFRKIKIQYADFSLFMNGFDDPDSTEDRAHFDPIAWWGTYGVNTPELRDLALKILGQPSSSSCCERNWSTYGHIHSMKRNKLTPERAEDLVFVHNNLRLLSRKTKEYQSGPSRMWDVGGDGVESFDGVGFLKGADLSFDEPEFEDEMLLRESGEGEAS